MKRTYLGAVLAASGAISLWMGSPAQADRFYLTEDRLIEGVLVREDTSTVTFQLDGAGLWTLSRHSLFKVEKESEGTYWLRQGERHARRNRLDRARKAFESARKFPDTEMQATRRLADIDVLEKSVTPETSTAEAAPPAAPVAQAGGLEEIAKEEDPPAPAPEAEAPKAVARKKVETAPAPPSRPTSVAVANRKPSPNPKKTSSPVAKGHIKIDPSLSELIRKYSRMNGVDPLLVKAMITVESRWNPRATSKSGARGLMQLMPETATALGVEDPYDPEQNIRAGTKYLGQLFREFEHEDWQYRQSMVIAAYNAGPNRIREVGDYRTLPESVRYTEKVLRAYRLLQDQKNGELAFLGNQLTR